MLAVSSPSTSVWSNTPSIAALSAISKVCHVEALREIVAAGVGRPMLPRIIGDNDRRLASLSDTLLEQPLWMLYHRQDQDVPHLKAARSWIRKLVQDG
jgi:DNA-binding transcriptional LysR family regulator